MVPEGHATENPISVSASLAGCLLPSPREPARPRRVPSSRGLGHHPLKVETRVRTPLGLLPPQGSDNFRGPRGTQYGTQGVSDFGAETRSGTAPGFTPPKTSS